MVFIKSFKVHVHTLQCHILFFSLCWSYHPIKERAANNLNMLSHEVTKLPSFSLVQGIYHCHCQTHHFPHHHHRHDNGCQHCHGTRRMIKEFGNMPVSCKKKGLRNAISDNSTVYCG